MNTNRSFKRFCIALVAMFFCVLNGNAQGWEKRIKYGDNNSIFNYVCQTKDSSYWLTGHTSNKDKSSSILVKLDKNGNKISHKSLEASQRTRFETITSCGDNGVLVYLAANIVDSTKLNRLQKLDKNGNMMWEHKTRLFWGMKEVVKQNILYTTKDSIILLNKNGIMIWKKPIPNASSLKDGLSIQFADDTHFLISTISNQDVLSELKYDYDGNLLDTKEIYKAKEILDGGRLYKRDKLGDYIGLEFIIEQDTFFQQTFFKVSNKQLIWEQSIAGISLLVSGFMTDFNNNVVVCGQESTSGGIKVDIGEDDEYSFDARGIILVIDELGNYKSIQYYGEDSDIEFTDLIESNDGYYVAIGGVDEFANSSAYILKTKAAQLSNLLKGKIILDDNNNCAIDSLEKNAKNWVVKVKSNNNQPSYYSFVNKNGNYQVLVDTGRYTLKFHVPSPYYRQTCDSTIEVKNFGANQYTLNLFTQKTISCPYLSIDLGSRAFRPCFDVVQVVNFCNHGTAIAQNAYVEVKLDANLTYQSSTKTAIAKGNNLYRFDLGNIPTDSCGQFTITSKVACDNSLLGKTLCSSAHIYPDSICQSDQGKIKVNGTCNGAQIQFEIKNESDKNMSLDKQYIVIEDHVMFMQGSFKLNPNETKPITIQAKAGKTYRLIAEQTNPIFGAIATTAFENCNVSASPSTGFVNQFPQGDDSPFEDIDCRVVTASYDPNDKQAIPQGVQNQHFTMKNTDLEYTIRFQNKGTDTAFVVVIKDTLSQHLDPATIQPGASSHAYRFDLSDKGIAKFTFLKINLPHQKVNDEGSNGFVKFRIKQKHDLANNTIIKNKAAIYFDYNAPIITNETYHTIGENWLIIVPTKEHSEPNIVMKIAPNPFSENTTIELEGDYPNLLFKLYDLNGQLLRNEKFNANRLDFERNGLNSGMYLFEIISDGKAIQQGKIVVL